MYNRVFGEGLTECEEWRRWYWEVSVRRSMKQTWQCPSVTYCGFFHSQITFVCICVRHKLALFAVLFSLVFWVSYLLNHNNTNSLQILELLAFLKDIKTHSRTTCTANRMPTSDCCPLLPLIARQFFYRYYFRLCPSVWLKLGLLWIDCYGMWRFCSLMHAPQFIELSA